MKGDLNQISFFYSPGFRIYHVIVNPEILLFLYTIKRIQFIN